MEILDLPQRFAALLEELTRVQSELDAAHAALGAGPDAAVEERAAALRQQRSALFERWGVTALAWTARGGQVLLGGGGPAPVAPDALTEELGGPPDDAPGMDWLDDEADAMTVEAPATEMDLARLREAVLSPRWSHSASRPPSFDPTEIQALCSRIGPPVPLADAARVAEEVSRLATELDNLDYWRRFPRAVQRALVGVFAARLRHVQDELPAAMHKRLDKKRLSMAFPYLTRFSEEAQPGFVKGLSRGQVPDHGSWSADAREWWETLEAELSQAEPAAGRGLGVASADRALDGLRKLVEGGRADPQSLRSAAILTLDAGVAADNPGLVRALRDHLSDLEGDGRLKGLRRAIRNAAKAEEALESEDGDDALAGIIPQDWPYLALTRGKTAVIVGGDPREKAMEAIQQALGFAAVSWESGSDVRAVQALAGRIERGGVDFVIFLQRFISHKLTDILMPPCKASGISWVMVEHGYGLTRVKLAIERYLTV